jgi:hypothetical protein
MVIAPLDGNYFDIVASGQKVDQGEKCQADISFEGGENFPRKSDKIKNNCLTARSEMKIASTSNTSIHLPY